LVMMAHLMSAVEHHRRAWQARQPLHLAQDIQHAIFKYHHKLGMGY